MSSVILWHTNFQQGQRLPQSLLGTNGSNRETGMFSIFQRDRTAVTVIEYGGVHFGTDRDIRVGDPTQPDSRGVSNMLSILRATIGMVIAAHAPALFGQMIHQDVGNHGVTDSYYESGAVSGMFQGPNWFFRFGDSVPPLAPFGGQSIAGGGGLAGGIGWAGGKTSGHLNFNFAQGSSRSMTTGGASVTTMDGFPGSIQSQTLRPFVTGVTPIVSSSSFSNAETIQNQRQLASLRQSQVALANKKLQSHLQRAETAFDNGRYKMARANLKSALRLVSKMSGHPQVRSVLLSHIKEVGELIKQQNKAERSKVKSKNDHPSPRPELPRM